MEYFSFCDISIAVEGDPSPVRDAVVTMFSLVPQQKAVSSAPVLLKIYDVPVDQPLSMLPEWCAKTLDVISPSPFARVFAGNQGDTLVVTCHPKGRECSWLSADNKRLLFVAQKAGSGKSGLSVTGSLVAALRELLGNCDKALLHAAALRCPDGTGILINADGGGGKSTTALSLIRHGARMLSDDLVSLSWEDSGACIMTGFPESMNLTEQTFQFFDELRTLLPRYAREGEEAKNIKKMSVNPEDIYPGCFCRHKNKLNVVLFTEISEDGPVLEPLSPPQFLGKLIHAHTFADHQKLKPKISQKLLDLSFSIPAFTLKTGRDPERLGAWLLKRLPETSSPTMAA
jgi:hypothetical protein